MEHITIGSTGLAASRIGLGTWATVLTYGALCRRLLASKITVETTFTRRIRGAHSSSGVLGNADRSEASHLRLRRCHMPRQEPTMDSGAPISNAPLGREIKRPEDDPRNSPVSHAVAPYSIEERTIGGDTLWVAIRARGAVWSWLTPEEAVAIGRVWIDKYDPAERS